MVGVDWAHMLVMFGGMVLGDIVTEVFSTRVPRDINIVVAGLIRDPKIAHFHGAGSLMLDSIIRYTDGRVVVTVNRGRRLWVAHFGQD